MPYEELFRDADLPSDITPAIFYAIIKRGQLRK
jgi:hypothetical protein